MKGFTRIFILLVGLCLSGSAFSLPLIKYYYTDSCMWCVKEKPIIQRIKKEGKAKVEFINASSGGFGVFLFPTIKILIDGKVVKTFIGFTSYNAIVGKLNEF